MPHHLNAAHVPRSAGGGAPAAEPPAQLDCPCVARTFATPVCHHQFLYAGGGAEAAEQGAAAAGHHHRCCPARPLRRRARGGAHAPLTHRALLDASDSWHVCAALVHGALLGDSRAAQQEQADAQLVHGALQAAARQPTVGKSVWNPGRLVAAWNVLVRNPRFAIPPIPTAPAVQPPQPKFLSCKLLCGMPATVRICCARVTGSPQLHVP